MKKSFLFVFILLICTYTMHAQHNVLSAGATQTLTITNGTVFSADSLVLTPTGNFTFASNAILETPVAVPGFPTNSISRVYYLNTPIVFTGSILIYYQLSELNGNTESALQYIDSTSGNWWVVSAFSADNPTYHFVLQNALADMFVVATAAQTGTVLLLKLISFTGEWKTDHTELNWMIDENELSENFIIERSTDGLSWQEAGKMQASAIPGKYSYSYNDYNSNFNIMFFRIKITGLSGEVTYSPTVKVSKGNSENNMYVVGKNNNATIYFSGMQPKKICIINAAGQIVWSDNTAREQYHVNNLLAGFYLVQYEINGTILAKKFVLY